MADGTVDSPNKTVGELQRELDAANTRYDKLNTAHDKLKGDFSELKAGAGDAASLQKQIEGHIKDKTKLLNEKEALQADFDGFKKDATKKDLKVAAQNVLTDLVKPSALATALKLIDLEGVELDENGAVKADSLKAKVDALKASDGFLFKDGNEKSNVTTPDVKRATDRITSSAYETEVAEAIKKMDPKLLEDVIAKYQT